MCYAKAPRGSPLHFLAIGGNLHPLEWLLFYFAFPILFYYHTQAELSTLFWTNAWRQIVLFTLVVQLPLFVTGHMIYVDIGWPFGLCVLAMTAFGGPGWIGRRYTICGILFLHGARMAIGAIILFGRRSKFKFRFSEDLPRYSYAKHRWVHEAGMPEKLWWLKAQHDTLQQCLANSGVLSLPVLLLACDTSTEFYLIEIVGYLGWIFSWAFENIADLQKAMWIDECRERARQVLEEGEANAKEKAEKIKLSIIGMPPYDTEPYFLWTMCRHPNYFGEWGCWFSIVLAALPTLFWSPMSEDMTPAVQAGLLLGLCYTLRMFYDCLVHWTGAGPAEHFSALKRKEAYTEYQRKIPCFWPLFLPNVFFLDHYQRPHWQREGAVDIIAMKTQ